MLKKLVKCYCASITELLDDSDEQDENSPSGIKGRLWARWMRPMRRWIACQVLRQSCSFGNPAMRDAFFLKDAVNEQLFTHHAPFFFLTNIVNGTRQNHLFK